MPKRLLEISFLALCLPVVASAATISVTTTSDTLTDDASCSLREAVTAANTNAPFNGCDGGDAYPEIDVIELPAGIYTLTLGAAGDDANLGGDLDFVEEVTLRGLGDDFVWWDDPDTADLESLDVYNDPDGFPRTFEEADLPAVVIENGLGDPAVLGDGDRVIHLLPLVRRAEPEGGLPTPRGTFRFENLAIARGDASCTGPGCSAGAAGIYHQADAHLELFRAAIYANRMSCSGDGCGSFDDASAYSLSGAGDFVFDQSVLVGNASTCSDPGCRSGNTLWTESASFDSAITFTHSLLYGNRHHCSAEGCRNQEFAQLQGAIALTFEQVALIGNEQSCSAGGLFCDTEDLIEPSTGFPCNDEACFVAFRDVEISENSLTCEGFECDTDEILEGGSFFDWSMIRVRIRDNIQSCVGTRCDVDEVIDQSASFEGSFVLRDVELLDNVNFCSGAGCNSDECLDISGSGFSVIEDVFLRGETRCEGEGCISRNLVDLREMRTIAGLEIRDSVASCVGDMCRHDSLVRVEPTNADEGQRTTIEDLRIVHSQATCSGRGCAAGTAFDPLFQGTGGLLAIDGGDGEAEISGLLLANNETTFDGAFSNAGRTWLRDSFIVDNEAARGGGVYNAGRSSFSVDPGRLELEGVAIMRNTAIGEGGGIYNPPGATLRLVDSRIGRNEATDGGGIFNEGVIQNLDSSTRISGNLPNQCVDSGNGIGCSGIVFADGFESRDTSAWSFSTR